jgi:hypothetical protein
VIRDLIWWLADGQSIWDVGGEFLKNKYEYMLYKASAFPPSASGLGWAAR